MPIDPSILQGIRPVQAPSILDTYAQITELQARKAAGEERRAAAQEKQQIRAQEAHYAEVLQRATRLGPDGRPTIDMATLLGGDVPADMVFAAQKSLDETAKRIADLETSQYTAEEKATQYLGGLATVVRDAGYHPNAFGTALVAAKARGALTQEQVVQALQELPVDPTAIQRYTDAAIARAQRLGPQPALQRITVPDPADPTKSVYQFVRPEEGATYPVVPEAVGSPAAVGSFEDYVVRRFGPAPTAEQITQARKDYQQADDRPRITVNTGQRPITQTAEAGLISRLNSQWTKATAPKRELDAQLATMRVGIRAAEAGDIAQGTEAVLQPFLKILDPNSVVREGEFWRLKEGQSWISQAQSAVQRITKGGYVPLPEMKKYAALAEQIATRYDSYVRGERTRIGRVADRYTIPQELVFESTEPLEGEQTAGAGGGGGGPKKDPLGIR